MSIEAARLRKLWATAPSVGNSRPLVRSIQASSLARLARTQTLVPRPILLLTLRIAIPTRFTRGTPLQLSFIQMLPPALGKTAGKQRHRPPRQSHLRAHFRHLFFKHFQNFRGTGGRSVADGVFEVHEGVVEAVQVGVAPCFEVREDFLRW